MHLEGSRAPCLASAPQGGHSRPFTADGCDPPLHPGRPEGGKSWPDLPTAHVRDGQRAQARTPRIHCSTKCEDHDGDSGTETRQHASRLSRRRRVRWRQVRGRGRVRVRVRVRVRRYWWRGPMCPCYACTRAHTRGRRGSSARLGATTGGPERAAQESVGKHHWVQCVAAHVASQAAIRTRIELASGHALLRSSGHALLSVARNARRHGEHVAGRACARRRGARRLHLSRSPVSRAVVTSQVWR